MHTQFLHFDSSSSINNLNPSSTSSSTLDSYNSTFKTHQIYRNVTKIHLKSVEIPVAFFNIRTGSTDTLKFIVNGTQYNLTLVEKNYTTIASLLTYLNILMTGLLSGSGSTISINLLSSNVNKLQFTFSGTTPSSFSIIDTNLSKYILGFRQSRDSLSTNIYNAYSVWNLNIDNYINLYIPAFLANANQSSQFSSFKIPLNTFNGQVYYYFENNSFPQYIEIKDSNFTLASFNAIIMDKFGNNINSMGLDYSFTLLLEYQ